MNSVYASPIHEHIAFGAIAHEVPVPAPDRRSESGVFFAILASLVKRCDLFLFFFHVITMSAGHTRFTMSQIMSAYKYIDMQKW